MIDKMLVFNPNRRVTVEQALEHPYLASLHDVNDEPASAVPFEFDFESEKLSEETIADLIFDDMLHYHDPVVKQELLAGRKNGM